MNNWLVYTVGFVAQILFSGRLIFQWMVSEKKKQVVTPQLFWKLSLLASFLLFVYGWMRHDFAIMLGQTLTYFIYIRNLQLQGEWQKAPKWFRTVVLAFPLFVLYYGYNNNTYDLNNLFDTSKIPLWLILLGTVAQIIFTLRFVYQWIYSERRKDSVLPKGFWILSTIGALMILAYAIFRKDPVLLAGHGLGSVIYIRNLMILNKQHGQHH